MSQSARNGPTKRHGPGVRIVVGLLEEHVGQQHRALRVAGRDGDERVDELQQPVAPGAL